MADQFGTLKVRISGPPEAGTLLDLYEKRTGPSTGKVLRPGGAGFGAAPR